ncbi:MAG TPA: winged helix-turn-helix domain-containing protein [Alphaproteobacteria bacterium]|nr:winged helix-turn-helix domain-containing protein [Alphaproteobacteria bacterium]
MKPVLLTNGEARRLWLAAQKLDVEEPFGAGPEAVARAVQHLGYVQIDTIHVIERAHHHILFTRMPRYRREHLRTAQSVDKSVFEYWTHALSYIAVEDIRYFLPDMRRHVIEPQRWYADGDPDELRRVLRRIRREGPISIRDVDDEPVEKDHPWASRKPTKRILQMGFYNGKLTISARQGMVKTYELIDRHFGWPPRPRPATERQILDYLVDRALRSQGLVSAESIAHLRRNVRRPLAELLEQRVRSRKLVPVVIAGAEKVLHYATEAALAGRNEPLAEFVHILSPFDPLLIQRRRTGLIFGYEHLFEAYVTPAKRQLGYFTLPVLVGDEIVAGLDLKTDRTAGRVLIQAWHWFGNGKARTHKRPIEEALGRFERFQLEA